ncbi:ABC transporter permease [Thermodesulfobacteriota bacterium]
MLVFKLALRNIIGAGMRTWLNVLVLSFAFVIIIWNQGFIEGMSEHAMHDMIKTEMGGGQFWHRRYDPYDPLALEFSHGRLSAPLADLVSQGEATPILVTSGAIFPQGRVQTALLKGVDPKQQIVTLPSAHLDVENPDSVPAIIGTRMAKQCHLEVGDYVTARWRDINGTFDATDLQIVHIMSTTVPTVDSGQIWIPLNTLRTMLQAPQEASLVILGENITSVPKPDATWVYRDLDYLLRNLRDIIKRKSLGSSILYTLLLFMALLAIFDTQVLSIFRRRKEMGTLMALGMPRSTIIGLFTLEGAFHGVLALCVGAIYGVPLLALTARKGMTMPEVVENMGVAIPKTLYPSYGFGLVAVTTAVVLIAVTFVSFLPTRRISKLKPTDALRGKTT